MLSLKLKLVTSVIAVMTLSFLYSNRGITWEKYATSHKTKWDKLHQENSDRSLDIVTRVPAVENKKQNLWEQ